MVQQHVTHLYKQIPYWVQHYGNAGMLDQQAVQTFMDCETTEMVVGLRNELVAVSSGAYSDQIFDRIVGVKRRVMHGSYEQWAKMMLLWMASYKP